jgi:hypothetical protein
MVGTAQGPTLRFFSIALIKIRLGLRPFAEPLEPARAIAQGGGRFEVCLVNDAD